MLARKPRTAWDMDAKAEQQKQEPGFASEDNGEAFNLENNDKSLPVVPTG